MFMFELNSLIQDLWSLIIDQSIIDSILINWFNKATVEDVWSKSVTAFNSL